jgi:hypothetical protein
MTVRIDDHRLAALGLRKHRMRQPFFDDQPESEPVSNLGRQIRDKRQRSIPARSDRKAGGRSPAPWRGEPRRPEAHFAYATHLYIGCRDYERARVQLAIARRSMPNNTEAMVLQAFMDRRQGSFEKAIQN